ncbi:MAG: dienelactone hydrolase family protein [Candidatus Sulfotelmatobacter sp.]
MGDTVRLKASDGHELDTYVSWPSDPPIAGLVVIQEAFGVNRHIRSVVDGYAKDGFLTVAPALFDRIQQGVESSSMLMYPARHRTGQQWLCGGSSPL